MKYLVLILCVLWSTHASAAAFEKGEVQRVILSLYSSKDHPNPRGSPAHRYLEMPLNHMGYYLRFADIEKPLPPLEDDVKGVVVWLASGRHVEDEDAYLDWLQGVAKARKKIVFMDDIGIGEEYRKKEGSMDKLNRMLAYIGMRDLNSFNSITYEASVLSQDNEVIGFERALPESLPPYQETIAIPGVGVSHLKLLASKTPEVIHDLVITGPGGGYVASGYSIFEGYPLLPIQQIEQQQHIPESERERPDPVHQWYIDPFAFMKLALGIDTTAPIPDVTTVDGMRVFYSHIDGDGWNNVTQIKKYSHQKMLSSQVIQKEILEPYPDIPINVSVIAEEMDPDCYGLSTSREVAEEIFRLPNVEPSSHTYSHPLFWGYFEHYKPVQEARILDRYPPRPRRTSIVSSLLGQRYDPAWEAYLTDEQNEDAEGVFERLFVKKGEGELMHFSYYEIPRSYACTPYDVTQEIEGSIAYVKQLAPEEKRDKVRLVQWSGNTTPYEGVLKEVRTSGHLNINGGDSRYDSEYPSYASVSPIGAQVGQERQIYSSNSNENTYTNLWTDRFYGFIYLQTTVRNTEIPMRVQPFNIYYHMFSGEKQASLAALKSNMEFARQQDMQRLFASDFVEIAEGYYSARIVKDGSGGWHIKNRGKLHTVRLDGAVLKTVDFERSLGVLGQRYYQGSLYISLDPAVDEPIVYIKKKNTDFLYESGEFPYVVESTWLINRLIYVKKSLMFTARGFGKGNISIKFPSPAQEYDVTVTRGQAELYKNTVTGDQHGRVTLTLDVDAKEPIEIAFMPRNH